MKRKILSLMLAAVMALGLAAPAMAYSTPDFSDVPPDHWAYEPVMKMADAGVIKGTGAGMFSPDKKVSAEMLLTLVGRIAFPEVKVGKEDTWYGPYVKAAQSAGWLEGTKIDPTDTAAEVTRYDMAVVLAFAAKKLGIAEKTVDTGKIKDFGEIPNKYTAAVTQVYGNGLIKGDGNGNFSGTSTMRRDEAAAVMSRLIALKPGGSTGTTPEKPTESPEEPSDAPMVTYKIRGELEWTQHVIGRPADAKRTYPHDVTVKVYYTKDGGQTSTLLYEGTTGNKRWNYDVPFGEEEGRFSCSFELPEDAFSGDGKGIYVSAETEINGQRLVTSNLRTDGRAYKDLHRIKRSDERGDYCVFELTPPEGEKAHFTFQGYVEGGNFAKDSPDYRLPNFTVQLYLANGTLLGEAVSKADGTFSMDCEVDALDDGFSATKEIYYVTAFGEYNGSKYEKSSTLNNGKLNLLSLYRLDVCDEIGQISASGGYRVNVYDFCRVEQ